MGFPSIIFIDKRCDGDADCRREKRPMHLPGHPRRKVDADGPEEEVETKRRGKAEGQRLIGQRNQSKEIDLVPQGEEPKAEPQPFLGARAPVSGGFGCIGLA